MHEKSMPLVLPATTEGSLADIPARNAAEHPGAVAFSVRSGAGWTDVTAATFAADVAALAKGLIAAGIAPGEAVGIMSRTRYEWTVADFALWSAGAVPVPIYETSSPDQVQWILADSGAVGVVVETAAHLAAVEQNRGALPGLRHVWVIDQGDIDSLSLDGNDVDDAELEARRADLDRDSLATVIYTSGTTGRPKGVELTHGNFLTLAENTAEEIAEVVKAAGSSTLLFLPLAHVFARFIEVLAVTARVRMGHSSDLKTLLDDFASFQPTFILAVPRVFEKVYNSAEAKAEAGGKGKIFAGAAAAAVAWSEAQDAGSVPLGLRVRHAVFDKLVYAKLREAMGGKVQYAVSGGAPLGTRLGHFYRGIGITILEGYGLTETTAPATVNLATKSKIGTVGPALPGVGVRIADDGEVEVRGINVFKEYWRNPEATAATFDGDWFKTGDIGAFDSEGFLTITGRKKEILVTAGGKNVAPAALEDPIRANPIVGQVVVVGDQKPFISALITLDSEMLPAWLGNNGLPADMSLADAAKNPAVRAEIQRAIDAANANVSRAESIRKFTILSTEWSEASGHLTPKMSIKRNVIMDDFADEITELYNVPVTTTSTSLG